MIQILSENPILTLCIGAAIGFAAAMLLSRFLRSGSRSEIKNLLAEADSQYRAYSERMSELMSQNFAKLSLDALNASTTELIKHASQHLASERSLTKAEVEGKKELIDSSLQNLRGELSRVTELIRTLEGERQLKFGELSAKLQATNEQTGELIRTTKRLNEVLSSTKSRGQWGERIAEDILRVAGLVEDVNYIKQATIAGDNTRPDFTFLLPKNLKLNMDVKFPLENYVRFLDNDSAEKHKRDFFKDVRLRIKEVSSRNYINPADNTVDCALMLIPNDGIFTFIVSEDRELLDFAMKQGVVCCSPMTLFAVLTVIRQAVDHFSVEKTATELIELLLQFRKNWDKYLESFEKLGRRLDDCQKEYSHLLNVRTKQLDRPLEKLAHLRLNSLTAPLTSQGKPLLGAEDARGQEF